jgi:hypothetical protein
VYEGDTRSRSILINDAAFGPGRDVFIFGNFMEMLLFLSYLIAFISLDSNRKYDLVVLAAEYFLKNGFKSKG